jgi:transcriptional regulator of heat shock response
MTGQLIFELSTNNENAKDNFAQILIDKLEIITPTTIKKKIITCCIELIQNNLKYNSYPATLQIIEYREFFIINIIETIKKDPFIKTSQIINRINETDLTTLKNIYNNNLDSINENTGNGLILCRLKSHDKIITEYKEIHNSKLIKFGITIKIRKK